MHQALGDARYRKQLLAWGSKSSSSTRNADSVNGRGTAAGRLRASGLGKRQIP
jgi:hypothetical protein